MTRLFRAVLAAGLLLAASAAGVAAHPLGNFTVNQYAGVRVEPDRIVLDVVVDAAEVPTFQLVRALDRDGDGSLANEAAADLAADRCLVVGRALSLTVDGAAVALRLVAAGMAFPEGNGGLPTMRLACVLEGDVSITAPASVAFRNDYEPAGIGWREVVVTGSATTIAGPGVASRSPSARLSAYPASLASAPDVREATVEARPGGPVLAPFVVPEAPPVGPIALDAGPPAAIAGEAAAGASRAPGTGSQAAPGGAGTVPALLRGVPTSPLVAIASILVAAILGAGHALTPGHGKTLMAAYLVGTRGTPRHAVGLGLAVAVSHTAGILALALVVVAAERTLPVEAVVRGAPVVAAASIAVVGGWMLLADLRRRRAAAMHERAHGTGAGHEHPHDHDHEHPHDHPATADPALEHAHGPIRHRHAPAAGTTVSWRGLVLLGLAGGLVPSASALLILLGSVAAGQAAWGVLLVLAFGIGMAGVMGGIGLALVVARRRIERSGWRPVLPGPARLVPTALAVLVLVAGIVLTTQAVAATGMG